MARASRRDAGLTLLEVLVALTVLLGTLTPLVALTQTILARARLLAASEEQLSRASGVLLELALLPRASLERRLGVYQENGLAISVQRPTRDVFRLAVSDTATVNRPLLVTLVRRERSTP